MAHHSATRSSAERPNLYAEITDSIIAELEAGRAPWVQPWEAARAPLTMPKNAATGRRYSGINILILWRAVIMRGFEHQSWLTFRQALKLGGNVRKGEHGTTVVYADRFTPDDERRRARAEGREADSIPFLKRFTVFSVEQCEGLPEETYAPPPPIPAGMILPHAKALIDATGAEFRIGGAEAFPDKNLVVVDLGTATTLVAVSRKRDFLGGVIMPGMRLAMESLKSNTAKLMEVDIEVPDTYLGQSTRECIQRGLFFGHLGAMREIVAGYRKELFAGEDVTVIGTGGFSQLFREEKVFDIILPDLVLQGLRLAFVNSKAAQPRAQHAG